MRPLLSSNPSNASLSMTAAAALILALPLACKSEQPAGEADQPAEEQAVEAGAAADEGAEAGAVEQVGGDEQAAPLEEPDDPRAAAVTIARADAALAGVTAKGTRSLGFSLEKVIHLFALAATAKVPDWGAPGEGEAKLVRDDDLDSAWTCAFEAGAEAPCVLGLALPETAKVEALRLYVAAGPRYRDYKGHPRVAKVRVHTDAGYVEASLQDGANHNYVRFSPPVETQSLAIEVLDVHAGNKDAVVHIAEVEVYGADGAPRVPMQLDPARAWVSWETDTWGEGPEHTIRQLFVNYSPAKAEDPEAGLARKRLTRATAVFGRAGDDFLLFERMFKTDCEAHEGSYLLFDRRNRMFYPLVDLGGAGGQVYRHGEGRGFAVGWVSAGRFTVKGVVEEGGTLKWKRPPKTPPEDPAALLREWGFEPTPMSRGESIASPPEGCHRAGGGEIDPLTAVAKLPDHASSDPSKWLICDVGSAKLYTQGGCGTGSHAYLVAGGKLVGEQRSKQADDRGFNLRRVGEGMFVELSREQGASASLSWVTAEALVELESAGGLAVRPPAACASCGDAWRDPEASEVEGEDAPGEVDEAAGLEDEEPEDEDEPEEVEAPEEDPEAG
ncbi:hypothetical protein [Pseudenhygromyxa sp. WMMC2535]|uniref:hypothetical protein n=1 Tax=Pseudenhygromyxa sp. WMMC2535 TaxID=2712867 RepID=UPI001C3DB760|nr:hypothetical protein [Pseudenhygromyxa sp. WMMC2535]